jgi:hypothetical protein
MWTSVAGQFPVKLAGWPAKWGAIEVRLDHRDGYSVMVVIPYSIVDEEGVVYEEAVTVRGEDRVFPR